MQHVYNFGDGVEFVLRHREPGIERLEHLSPNVFPGHRAYVCERLQQGLK